MLPSAHVYGHHQFNPPDSSSWSQQQQQQQQSAAQHHAQQQQQQHYNRLSNPVATQQNVAVAAAAAAAAAHDGAHENISEDNRRTMGYIADLLNESTREAALLELSKKREQVPELALILWHSFGGFSLWPFFFLCNKASAL
jgi:CCR4-NOT transcription complex subunit 9